MDKYQARKNNEIIFDSHRHKVSSTGRSLSTCIIFTEMDFSVCLTYYEKVRKITVEYISIPNSFVNINTQTQNHPLAVCVKVRKTNVLQRKNLAERKFGSFCSNPPK